MIVNEPGTVIKGLISHLVILGLIITSLFLSCSAFVEPQVLPKWYGFIAGSILLSLILILFHKKIFTSYNVVFFVISIFMGYVLLRMFISGPVTLTTLSVISFYLLYLSFKAFSETEKQYFVLVVICACILQSLYGIGQWANIFSSTGGFKVSGSFDNPAGFAACLAAGFPFCLTFLDKGKMQKIIGCLCLAIISFATILSGSRAGILSISIVFLVYIVHKYKTIASKFLPYAILLFIMLAVGLVFLKKASAMGRIAIWNNAIQMVKDKPVLGHGEGGFSSQYMLYQANYFAANPNSDYARLADNVTHPFNEYLLLTIEYGIVGLLLLLAVFLVILIYGQPKLILLLCLLSVGIFSCFSYPLRYPFVSVVLAYVLAGMSNKTGELRRIPVIVGSIILLTAGLLNIMLIKDIRFEYKWGKIAQQAIYGKTDMDDKTYRELYKNWNGNPLFLYNYGAVLNRKEYYPASNVVMKICENYLNDYEVQIIIGYNYFNMEELDLAKYHYELAHDMIPNRFLPLYCIMELYLKADNKQKAIEFANKIVKKEIKVNSHSIQNIIKEANKLISEQGL